MKPAPVKGDFEMWCKRMVSMRVARRVRRFWILPLLPFKKNWGIVIFVGGRAPEADRLTDG